ncbi:hypothetical protein [Nocardiopsis baichengensis]|uniref:hypothetical protein n=1 Tax=Nocardiopsis baichengensis TaxID=280240 RepID=UPI001EF9F432|nr:hypothetical protein [Nocardiopsis baichengensis]
MPSPRHDGVKDLVRESPQTVARLVCAKNAEAAIRPHVPLREASNELNDRPSRDFYPDNVFTQGSPSAPSSVLVVEIQHEKEEQKRRQIARYAAALWLFHRCAPVVAVVCPSQAAADFYDEPIGTELPGYRYPPVAIGPDDIPRVEDAGTVADDPALAALSVMAHGSSMSVLTAFLEGLSRLETDDSSKYYEYAYRLASQQVKQSLEAEMTSGTWPVYSPFAKTHYGHGHEDGRTEERAATVIDLLEARGLPVDDATRARITACNDIERLKAWSIAALTVDRAEEIFEA